MALSLYTYNKKRIMNWERVAGYWDNPDRLGAFYQMLLRHYYRFYVPYGLRIIEFGCGQGDLLAFLNPSYGVGIDFSQKMIEKARVKYPDLDFIVADAHHPPVNGTFDIIILSDIINDIWDVQCVFEKVRGMCHPKTRLILNVYNNLWRLPLSLAKKIGLGAHVLEQNWLTVDDIKNLLTLTGFQIISHHSRILFPFKIKGLSYILNRFAANIFPFISLNLTHFIVARPIHDKQTRLLPSLTVIIPARNEAGNAENIVNRIPDLGGRTEIIFVEGHSNDNTYNKIQEVIQSHPDRKCRLLKQKGKGKGDAVRLGFENAENDLLFILDMDMTVKPEDVKRFYDAIVADKGEFVNGVRLVYPMEDKAMRFLNMVGNKFFSIAFSWMLGQPVKDTLCGSKMLWKKDYKQISKNRSYFGDFDPFGDFDLLFGASKLNLKIIEMPVRYGSRTYGTSNIKRWQHGLLLLRMVFFAARRIKFI